jgi:hypothetical protein
MTAKISIREFARTLGVAEGTVRKAIDSGKIVNGVWRDPETGRPSIIPDVAASEWGKTYNPAYDRSPALRGKFVEKTPEPAAPAAPAAPSAPIPGSGKSLAELKRLTAEVRLQREALELREIKGQLVDKEKVYNALFAIGQEVKATVLTVPDRVIDSILAAPSRNEAHTLLYSALVQALEAVSELGSRNITGDGN